MDNRSIDEIIVDVKKEANAVNKKTTNSSNNDDERILVLDYPKKIKNVRDDR